MSAGLRFEDVCVELGGRRVVEQVTLGVAPGEVVGLVGPNGAGKSTLLRAGIGLLKAVTGTVTLHGRQITSWSRGDVAREMALVPQAPSLPALFDVATVVALGRTPYLSFLGQPRREDTKIVQTAMERAGIAELAARRTGELSGGERQRVTIARALAQEPRVLLLDEPTANLDLRYQASTLSLCRRLARDEGMACLVVLHDLALASHFCDRLLLLSNGRAVAVGTPSEVLRPELLSKVYQTGLRVIHHPETGAPLVIHASGEAVHS